MPADHKEEAMDKLTTLIEAHPCATDIHITEGGPVFLREQGALYHIEPLPELLPELEAGLTAEKKTIWEQGGTIDGSFSAGGVRCRLHLYRSAGRKAAALRLLPALDHLPPDRDEPWMVRLSACRSGLILITGPAGSGKSTALARFVQILAERPCHIITIEDPPEYEFSSGRALIHQREVGADTASFASGVREALREDPDVLVIGEMRDAETMAAALTAAETGHLVLATLHDGSAAGAVGRLVHAFPADRESEVRSLLASVLRAAAAQKLCRTGGRTFLLREILTNTPAVAHLIREGKDEQLLSYMEMGQLSMRTMKQALRQILAEETLSPEEAEQLRQAAEA